MLIPLAFATLTLASAQQATSGPAAPSPDPFTAPGVSLELARRRANTLENVAYSIRLDVTDTARAPGTIDISVVRKPSAHDLIIDFRGPELRSVSANGASVTDYVWRDGHIVIPQRHLRPGENQLSLVFSAAIAPAGASIIRYRDDTDGSTYLYTLLVPADANQLFPSFDQPDLKARITWSLTVPDGWTVLANGRERKGARSEARAGAQTWEFEPTEPISTYLAAFAAGPWATVTHKGTPEMRLFVRKSRLKEVDADSILSDNASAYKWLEDYFDVKYPFAKIDILLAPAFPFGGMEHVGAIFYNESSFIFREPPTPTQRYNRASTIYHEVAHQWFGDFVTMRWFDDLWLKEGFATYMGARVQEALRPEAGAWRRFYLRTKPAAYAVDATSGTVSVWQQLPNLDLAKGNYGPIVYNKAPAILRQLEHLVGAEAFRRGVHAFLTKHRYANATWQDLLASIGQASGTDLAEFGKQYMLRPGMPVVQTELRIENGKIRELALVQKPAREMSGDPGGWWPGKVNVRLGYTAGHKVLPVRFTGARTVVRSAAGLPAPDFVWANDGDFGYGLFLPDERSAQWLLQHASDVSDPLLRAMSWGALWDLVREARLPARDFVDRALLAFPYEKDENLAGSMLGRSLTALERYVPAEQATPLAARWEQLLLRRSDDDALPYALRKPSFDAFIGLAQTPLGINTLRTYLAETRAFNRKPIAQVSRWGAVRRLIALGAPDADSLYRAEVARDTTPERLRSAFVASAAFPAAENKARLYERFFSDKALNEEWVTASLGAFNDPLHAELSLPYLKPALERATWIRDNRRIFFLPNWLQSFIESQNTSEALQVVDSFLASSPDLPLDVRRKILQSRDELERTVRIRRR